ncbi:copper chaperone PCu(A)C [Nitratireductor sp. L15S-10]|uniref:copper chaperone PCu(A)C n=1 Tax=Nitratireductor sp. L15S-10 TaxID=3034028 RepID=UPI00385772B7
MSGTTSCRLPIALGAVVLLAASAAASERALDHANPPRTLTVEHAEILIADRDGSPARGFLTIWNGTDTPAYLAAVRSETFASTTIMRTPFNSDDDVAELVSGPLLIPAHAELQMRRGGIHLALADPASPIEQSESERMMLIFDDGREVEVSAHLVPTSDLLTNHRHGEGDRAAN